MRNQKFMWRNSQRVRNFNKIGVGRVEILQHEQNQIFKARGLAISMGKRASGARVYHFDFQISLRRRPICLYWDFGMSCYHRKYIISNLFLATGKDESVEAI
jgi:hypothetical protein